MFKFFPQIIIFLALAAIIVIVVRRLPKLAEIRVKERPKAERKAFLKLINFLRRLGSAFKNFSVSLFRSLYRKSLELKEKKPKAIEKEVRELVSVPSPTERVGAVNQDKLIDLLEQAAKFFGSGNFKEAEKNYIEIIKKDPQNIRAYKGLGKIYLKQNNLKDARASFEQVLKIQPDDQKAKTELKVIENKMAK